MKNNGFLKHFILFLGFYSSFLFVPILQATTNITKQSSMTSAAHWSKKWQPLKNIVESRVHQSKSKMKLTPGQMQSFETFLIGIEPLPTAELQKLQEKMPKTTVELLRSVEGRGVSLIEAQKMAAYLDALYDQFEFKNPAPFDENTSHIIGRTWSEIDYSGENMTWEKQKLKYKPYGIQDFKSLEMLKKFFPVESKLPYFQKIYKPRHPNAAIIAK